MYSNAIKFAGAIFLRVNVPLLKSALERVFDKVLEVHNRAEFWEERGGYKFGSHVSVLLIPGFLCILVSSITR